MNAGVVDSDDQWEGVMESSQAGEYWQDPPYTKTNATIWLQVLLGYRFGWVSPTLTEWLEDNPNPIQRTLSTRAANV